MSVLEDGEKVTSRYTSVTLLGTGQTLLVSPGTITSGLNWKRVTVGADMVKVMLSGWEHPPTLLQWRIWAVCSPTPNAVRALFITTMGEDWSTSLLLNSGGFPT